MALYIRNGRLEARAPLRTPKCEIDRFVASKRQWIMERLAQTAAQARERENFSLGYGHTLIYRGKSCSIAAKEGNRIGFDGERFYMPPNLSQERIQSACVQIYRLLAKSVLTEKTLAFAEVMGVSPASVRINGANTRWGSCSSQKSVNFSWRLMMADDGVIDYVIVHELAHCFEMNHSERFWAIVEGVLPDYRQRKEELREVEKRLKCENWSER